MCEEVHYTSLKYRFTTENNGGGIEFSLAYGILPSALQCIYEKHIQCVKTIKIVVHVQSCVHCSYRYITYRTTKMIGTDIPRCQKH